MKEIKKCKICIRDLLLSYKYNKCELCRNKKIDEVKKIFKVVG